MSQKKFVTLQDCIKNYTTDQDKAISPEETVSRFKEKLANLDIALLKEVKRIDNGRLGIPVYFSVCGEDAYTITGTKKQMGKGASPIQAQASACMELAERFSFFTFKSKEENFLYGEYKEMVAEGYPVLPLRYLLQSVHDSSHNETFLENILTGIPMQWAWAKNLTTDTEVLLPFSWFYAINEFNGPSAGNSYEEAALQGICEIVERHVCALISHNKLETPRIDVKTVKDPVAQNLIKIFEDNNIDLYLNDFTMDTGICTVAALGIDRNTFPEQSEIVYTAGTTPDPEKALIRAVTEVAQLAGDFNSKSNYIASGLPKPLHMDDVAYVHATSLSCGVDDIPNLSDSNIRVEVENCVSALQKIGMDTFMLDVTHNDLKIPAIYTVVPGAHFRERSMIQDVGLFAAKLLVEQVRDPELLEEKLARFEQIVPDVYYLHFYRGKNLYETGAMEQSITHFQTALKKNPEKEDLPYIYSFMGSAYKDMGEYPLALAALEKGLAEDEERPDMYNTMGVCYFKQKRYNKAISSFERAVELNPSSAMDYANLGVNYRKVGNSEKAIHFFTLALSLDPSIEFAGVQLAELVAE